MTMGIIDGKPTVCYRLFNHLFPVRMQNMFLMNKTMKMHSPAYNSFDQDIESQTRGETTIVYRTPVAMTMLYSMGKVPYIVERKDVLTIYDLIVQHLNNWSREITNPISNLTPPPPGDLLLLENFSQFIYEDAMFEKETEMAKGRILEHDTSLNAFLQLFGGRGNVNALRARAIDNFQGVKQTEVLPTFGNNIGTAWDASQWGL